MAPQDSTKQSKGLLIFAPLHICINITEPSLPQALLPVQQSELQGVQLIC